MCIIKENYNMVFNNISIVTLFAEHEGFGINTDIFETNVLNLSVVIGVLIYYGRITFSKRSGILYY